MMRVQSLLARLGISLMEQELLSGAMRTLLIDQELLSDAKQMLR